MGCKKRAACLLIRNGFLCWKSGKLKCAQCSVTGKKRQPVDLQVTDLWGVAGCFTLPIRLMLSTCGAWMGGQHLVQLQGHFPGALSREAAVCMESCGHRQRKQLARRGRSWGWQSSCSPAACSICLWCLASCLGAAAGAVITSFVW